MYCTNGPKTHILLLRYDIDGLNYFILRRRLMRQSNSYRYLYVHKQQKMPINSVATTSAKCKTQKKRQRFSGAPPILRQTVMHVFVYYYYYNYYCIIMTTVLVVLAVKLNFLLLSL